MKGYLRFLAIIAVLAISAAACGDSGTSDFEQATEGSVSADDVFGGDADDDDSSFGTDDTLPSTIGNIPGVSGECEALLNIFLSFGGAFTGGGFDSPDLSAFSDLPGGLQDDVALMVQTLEAFSDGLEDLGIDLSDPSAFANLSEAQQQAFGELSEELDSDAFNQASDNLSAYGEAECAELAGIGN